MPPRLIINADDFGLTQGVNRAIEELHQAKVLTSATLMATGPAFEDAVAIAHANPALGVGCHILLTDGVPVLPPEAIPTLLGPDRKTFRPSLVDFVQALLRGKISEQEIEREALAQIQKLQHARINITHIDTHKHTHLFPAVCRPLLKIAEQNSIHAIRHPFEQPWSLALGHGKRIRRLQVKLLGSLKTKFEQQPQIRSRTILSTGGSIGISATGNLYGETLREILQAMPPEGTFELVCHPGYNDRDLDRITTRLRAHREIERNALLAEVSAIALHPNAPQLINYGELATRETRQFTSRTQPGRV
ncbi:MAG: ChbG/HpnK family deacetylase [Edaphobacter sp.]